MDNESKTPTSAFESCNKLIGAIEARKKQTALSMAFEARASELLARSFFNEKKDQFASDPILAIYARNYLREAQELVEKLDNVAFTRDQISNFDY